MGIGIAAACLAGVVMFQPPGTPEGRALLLGGVRVFGYQLQGLDVEKAAASPADLLIVEPQDDERMSRADVARLKRKPDGSRRIVLAYLSIGEAEDYRPYWQARFKDNPPKWLGDENPDWAGNFKVRYWDEDWQRLILGYPEAPLNQIVADGYDGVYLDIVDGFEHWEEQGVDDARDQMIAWVKRIGETARAKRPEFLVVPQNGEALSREPGYLGLVDAIGREDVYFEGDDPQDPDGIREVEHDLARFRKAGKPVFLVEYPTEPDKIKTVFRKARSRGYVPVIAVRPLDKIWLKPAPAR